MIEKRFTYEYRELEDGIFCIYNTTIYENTEEASKFVHKLSFVATERVARRIVGELNALSDENEQFRNIARDYNIPFDKLCSTFEDVLEENEQLKSKYSEQCIQLDFLKAENKHMKEVLDENEQLKKVIDEADDLIKSHLTNYYKTRWKNICVYYGVDIE